MKGITRTLWILSLVSLLTDTASEMLYPVMPIYLKHIGFSVLLIGILEGVAEAVAGLSKGYFGQLSDKSGKRVPFVQAGYALSAISKPMLALFVFPLWIFLARTLDRFGKGIRTAARDALLSDEATPQTKGRVFGFHRSMDTLGAVLGPSLALIYLYFFPEDYPTLFFIAFLPSLLAVAVSLFLKKTGRKISSEENKIKLWSFIGYWKSGTPEYRRLTGGLLAFALINSSDVFLLLKAKQSGLDDTAVIGVYIFYNLVYALFGFPLGILADKIGLRNMLLGGLAVFAAVYTGMGMSAGFPSIAALFFLYGVYAAATEGISKAWISNVAAKSETATAIGAYTAFQSVFALAASTIAGLVWYKFGAETLFVLTGGAALLVIAYFVIFTRAPKAADFHRDN